MCNIKNPSLPDHETWQQFIQDKPWLSHINCLDNAYNYNDYGDGKERVISIIDINIISGEIVWTYSSNTINREWILFDDATPKDRDPGGFSSWELIETFNIPKPRKTRLRFL